MIKVYLVGQEPRQRGSMQFPGDATPAEIDAFFTAYSKAGVVRAVESTPLSITPTSAEALSNLDYQAIAQVYDLITHKNSRVSLPACKITGELDVNGHGKVFTAAEKAAFQTAWQTVNGYGIEKQVRRVRFCQKT